MEQLLIDSDEEDAINEARYQWAIPLDAESSVPDFYDKIGNEFLPRPNI